MPYSSKLVSKFRAIVALFADLVILLTAAQNTLGSFFLIYSIIDWDASVPCCLRSRSMPVTELVSRRIWVGEQVKVQLSAIPCVECCRVSVPFPDESIFTACLQWFKRQCALAFLNLHMWVYLCFLATSWNGYLGHSSSLRIFMMCAGLMPWLRRSQLIMLALLSMVCITVISMPMGW